MDITKQLHKLIYYITGPVDLRVYCISFTANILYILLWMSVSVGWWRLAAQWWFLLPSPPPPTQSTGEQHYVTSSWCSTFPPHPAPQTNTTQTVGWRPATPQTEHYQNSATVFLLWCWSFSNISASFFFNPSTLRMCWHLLFLCSFYYYSHHSSIIF